MKSAASKSSLPTERKRDGTLFRDRKQSEPERRKQQSAKSSPAREIAPFFSIFYRGISGGISRVTKSQSRGEGMDKDGGEREEKGGPGGRGPKGTQTPTDGMSRKFAPSDKPPLPAGKGKTGDGRGGGWHKQSGRAKSTADLHAAKAAAVAEGKNWREEGQGTGTEAGPSGAARAISRKVVSSAPSSPQTGAARRKWFLPSFGAFRGHSQDPSPAALPPPAPLPHPLPASSTAKLNGFSRDHPQLHRNRAAEEEPTGELSFGQRIRLHKGVRTGKIPVDALLHTHRASRAWPAAGGEKRQSVKGKAAKGAKGTGGGGGGGGVYMSADDIRMLSRDPEYIVEALRTLGDEQPRVARSTPKHAAILEDPRVVHQRQRQHCLYPEDVYDKMVAESLLVCDLLQSHLDECIAGVRARSPAALSSPFTTPPGSPFMTRSTSMQPFPGASGTPGTPKKAISRVTISVSPMAQQAAGALPDFASGSCSGLPPFPTGSPPPPSLPPPPPPQVLITRPSFPSFGRNSLLISPPQATPEKSRLRPYVS